MAAIGIPEKIPYVGVGCIVVRDGNLLLVRNQRGLWSTPGGHLDFGESPDVRNVTELEVLDAIGFEPFDLRIALPDESDPYDR
jgi:8-oxo-dGTP diphosphatase